MNNTPTTIEPVPRPLTADEWRQWCRDVIERMPTTALAEALPRLLQIESYWKARDRMERGGA